MPFGRIASDPLRIALIERDRSLPPRELYDRIDERLERFERRWRTLTPAELARRGLHPSRGELTVEAMPERFIVGHLEDHVSQIEGILAGPDAAREPGVTLPELGSSLPEIFLRTAIVYLFLVLILRITGKREVGQMSILELIVILIISDAVQNSMVGENTTMWGGLVAVLTLFVPTTAQVAAHRSQRVRNAIEGEPRLLVRDGRLLTKALGEEHVEAEEVRAAVRAPGSPGSRTSGWPCSRSTARSASSRRRGGAPSSRGEASATPG